MSNPFDYKFSVWLSIQLSIHGVWRNHDHSVAESHEDAVARYSDVEVGTGRVDGLRLVFILFRQGQSRCEHILSN